MILLSGLVLIILGYSLFEFVGWLSNKTPIAAYFNNQPNYMVGATVIWCLSVSGFLTYLSGYVIVSTIRDFIAKIKKQK